MQTAAMHFCACHLGRKLDGLHDSLRTDRPAR
jgi:hypothetical protein